jgi:hypothetical protein
MTLLNPTGGGIRVKDDWGNGYYGAPRGGGRFHAGLDIVGAPGQQFSLPFAGATQNIGRRFDRGVLVTHRSGRYRAILLHGDPVTLRIIDPAQFGYRGMAPHIHLQLEQNIGGHWYNVNPTPFLFPFP